MSKLFDSVFEWMDRRTEIRARSIASTHGRRSFLQKAGMVLVGGAALPMLPFDRAYGRGLGEPDILPEDCDYWRYCSLHGTLCSQCGGSITQCPPGTQPSAVAWVGTCSNPFDGKDYLVSYNDCCGKGGGCGSGCSNQEGDRPGYRMAQASEANWCMANDAKGIACTVALVVGVAE